MPRSIAIVSPTLVTVQNLHFQILSRLNCFILTEIITAAQPRNGNEEKFIWHLPAAGSSTEGSMQICIKERKSALHSLNESIVVRGSINKSFNQY